MKKTVIMMAAFVMLGVNSYAGSDLSQPTVTVKEFQAAAIADAKEAWSKHTFQPGNDGKFSPFEVGMEEGKAAREASKAHNLKNGEAALFEFAFKRAYDASQALTEAQNELNN